MFRLVVKSITYVIFFYNFHKKIGVDISKNKKTVIIFVDLTKQKNIGDTHTQADDLSCWIPAPEFTEHQQSRHGGECPPLCCPFHVVSLLPGHQLRLNEGNIHFYTGGIASSHTCFNLIGCWDITPFLLRYDWLVMHEVILWCIAQYQKFPNMGIASSQKFPCGYCAIPKFPKYEYCIISKIPMLVRISHNFFFGKW